MDQKGSLLPYVECSDDSEDSMNHPKEGSYHKSLRSDTVLTNTQTELENGIRRYLENEKSLTETPGTEAPDVSSTKWAVRVQNTTHRFT
jgi:hypothetical protein